MTAVEFGRGDMKEAERAWRGINIVDQQMYLKETYLKDKLKWPPRVSAVPPLPLVEMSYTLLRTSATLICAIVMPHDRLPHKRFVAYYS